MLHPRHRPNHAQQQQLSWEMQAMPPRRDRGKPKFIVLKVTRDLQSNTREAAPQRHKGKAQSGGLVDADPWQATQRSEKLLETKFVFSWLWKVNIWLFPPALSGKDRTIHWALPVFPRFSDPKMELFGELTFLQRRQRLSQLHTSAAAT